MLTALFKFVQQVFQLVPEGLKKKKISHLKVRHINTIKADDYYFKKPSRSPFAKTTSLKTKYHIAPKESHETG